MPDYEKYDYKGELKGKVVYPAEIAAICHALGWRDLELEKAVACSLSESQGFSRARNTKRLKSTGEIVSCDVGIFQISVRVEDFDSLEDFWAVVKKLEDPIYNAERARALYKRRGWQPWVAMGMLKEGGGIALDPKAAGKYTQRATWGVMNFNRTRLGLPKVPSPWVKGGKVRLGRWAIRA